MLTNKTLNEVLNEIGSDGTPYAENDFNQEGSFCDYLGRQADFLVKAGVNCKKEDIVEYFASSYWEDRAQFGDEMQYQRNRRRAVTPLLGDFLPLLSDVNQVIVIAGLMKENPSQIIGKVTGVSTKSYVGKNGSALLYEINISPKRKDNSFKYAAEKGRLFTTYGNKFNIAFIDCEEFNNAFVLYWRK